MTVRTRFAPSPTGYLHIGGVRTALFNWLLARRRGGQFILRIDDTDRVRNVAAALEPILEGFRWLGLDWDEGPGIDGPHAPYYQSQRDDRYAEAVETLLSRGHAYRDYATDEERQAERDAAEAEKRPFVHSRRWMAEDDEQASRFEAEGRTSVVRLKMPREGQCRFRDLVRGDVAFDWSREQDHVVRRADGSFIYHLASVVDDQDFRITHVVRAIEHLSNTPRQIFIAQGLGHEPPEFAHLPYVAAPGTTSKLSKRQLDKYLRNADFSKLFDRGKRIAERVGLPADADTFNPVIVDFYREIGFLPDALVNYLLLLGWSLDDKTEEFTRGEMIEHFSLERVTRSPASFDPAKLLAFQSRHMNSTPLDRKVELVLPFLERAGLVETPVSGDSRAAVTKLVEAVGHRLEIAGDILDYDYFFVSDDRLDYDQQAVTRCVGKLDDPRDVIGRLRSCLSAIEPFESASLTTELDSMIENQQLHKRKALQALRVAVTGVDKGIGTYDTLELLGRDRCLNRIDRLSSRL